MAAGRAELAQHTRVEQLVAHADSDSADELRVDDHAQTHLVAELARERVGKPLLLVFGERSRTRDARDEPVTSLGSERGELVEHPLHRATTREQNGALDE